MREEEKDELSSWLLAKSLLRYNKKDIFLASFLYMMEMACRLTFSVLLQGLFELIATYNGSN